MTRRGHMRRIAAACLVAALAAVSLAEAQEPAAAPTDALNPLGAVGKSTLRGFLERPLFTPSRRAPQPPPEIAEPEPEPEQAAAPPPPAEQPNLRLLGVLEGPDEAIAVVQDVATSTTTQLRLGDMMDGWLVTAIDPVALRLTVGDRDEEYRLFDPNRRPDAEPDELADPQTPGQRQNPRQSRNQN